MRTGMEWDEWYHELCKTVAKKSHCHSRKVGAILVRDKAVVAQGYNGPPRNVRTCDERWLYDPKLIEYYNAKAKPNAQIIELLANSPRFKDEFEGKCPRYNPTMGFKSGQGLDWCVAGHAERNAIINAARNGIATKGTIMYMTDPPCSPCLVEIINAGIVEMVMEREFYYDASVKYLFEESGISWRIYDHLK